MNLTASQLIDLLESAGYDPASYSGRGMHGGRCVSVTVEPAEVLAVGAECVVTAMSDADDFENLDWAEAVARVMHDAREDNMGRDVVLYWPDLTWPADREDS